MGKNVEFNEPLPKNYIDKITFLNDTTSLLLFPQTALCHICSCVRFQAFLFVELTRTKRDAKKLSLEDSDKLLRRETLTKSHPTLLRVCFYFSTRSKLSLICSFRRCSFTNTTYICLLDRDSVSSSPCIFEGKYTFRMHSNKIKSHLSAVHVRQIP